MIWALWLALAIGLLGATGYCVHYVRTSLLRRAYAEQEIARLERLGAGDPQEAPASVRCSRCGSTAEIAAATAANWNAVFDGPVVVGYICAACQTPYEAHEGEANADHVHAHQQRRGLPQ